MKIDRWDAAAKKLLTLTETRQIEWQPTDELQRVRANERQFVGPAYVAEIDGKRIAVSEVRQLHFDEDGGILPYTGTFPFIEFVDDRYRAEWVWPVSSPFGDELLDSIRYHSSEADSFLDGFLADQQPA